MTGKLDGPGQAVRLARPLEAALAESDARLRTLADADAAPAMFWITEPDGSCVYLSEQWYAFTGQTPDDALGFGWLQATHPDDRASAERVFLDANARRVPFRLDYRIRRVDGVYRWAIDSAAPRFDADGEFSGFVGSVLDITGRRQAEDALRESELRFRLLFTSIDEGYCLAEMILDEAGRPVDYRFLEANPLFEDMTGLRDAVGRTARELVPGLEDHWVETYGRIALGGEPLRFQQGSEAMGRFFDVFVTGVQPRGRFALVFKDITAQRSSELAERRARRHAELLADTMTALEGVDGQDAKLRCLTGVLVPAIADRVDIVEHGPGEITATSIAVPLQLDGGNQAWLVLESSDPERAPYAEEDRGFARRLADRVGLMLARTREREEEHRIALRLQQALLPNAVLDHPQVAIAARYAAASGVLQVGGDWYDTFALPGGCLGLVVGDVVGHGLDAAAAMGRLRTAFAALAPHASGPGDMLSRLDAYAVGDGVVDFATACCATLDPRTGELSHASAGHPPMLAVTPDGTARWLDGGRSMAFYGRYGGARPQASTILEPGTLLVLYSDGLVERRRDSLDAGFARLEQVVVAGRDSTVDELCDRILTGLGVDRSRDDDAVVLCARLRAHPEP